MITCKLDIEMPKSCISREIGGKNCPFCLGCTDPKEFPFVKCQLIGNLGSMFNVAYSKPIDCPLVEE